MPWHHPDATAFFLKPSAAATRFYFAGLSERVIAQIMGWEEDYVSRIIRRSVDRKAAVKAAILQMQKARSGTGAVKNL